MTRTADTSAGHLIVRQLEVEGIERVYCVPGESYLDVLDGLVDSSIRTVVCRQEGGAAMAAMAEARVSGRAGIAMVTRGPGAANAMIAVHNAWQDGTPLVLFVGLIDSGDRGREAFQDFDLSGWFATTTKRVMTLDAPADAALVVRSALSIAESGRPGPVVIGLPENLLRCRVKASLAAIPELAHGITPPTVLADLTGELEAANTPVIVLGGEQWSADAAASIAYVAECLAVPVATDYRSADLIHNDSPAYAGMLAFNPGQALTQLIADADLLVYIGTGRTDVLSQGFTLGSETRTIIISSDPEIRGHHGRVDRRLTVQPRVFMAELHAWLRARPDAPVNPERQLRLRAAHAAFERFSTPEIQASSLVDLGELFSAIREFRDPTGIVTYGAGNYAGWVQRYLPSLTYPSLLAPKNGAMGFGIPAAVAAALAEPEREVLSFAGDGCFMMNGQELATAVAEKLSLCLFLMDNEGYGTIRTHQERQYPGRESGTRLQNPDFAQFARSFGAAGFTIDGTQDIREIVQRALQQSGVSLVHVKIKHS